MLLILFPDALRAHDREASLELEDPREERRTDVYGHTGDQIIGVLGILHHGDILLETVVELGQQALPEADLHCDRFCAEHVEGFLHVLGHVEAFRRLGQRGFLIDGDLLHAVDTEVSQLILLPLRTLLRTCADAVVESVVPGQCQRMEDILHAIMLQDLALSELIVDVLESHRMLLRHGTADRADSIDKVVIVRVMAADIVDLLIKLRGISRGSLALELLDDGLMPRRAQRSTKP